MPRWRRGHRNLMTAPGRYLLRIRQKPNRLRQRRYHPRGSDCVKVNVYWEIGVYNQLHAMAAALRVSVSALVSELLTMEEQRADVNFSSYSFKVVAWTADCRKILETLQERRRRRI